MCHHRGPAQEQQLALLCGVGGVGVCRSACVCSCMCVFMLVPCVGPVWSVLTLWDKQILG